MKNFMFIAVCSVGLLLTSCTKSVKEQANDYADQMIEAMKAGDTEKLNKIAVESSEWQKGLNEEDRKVLDEVSEERKEELEEATKEFIQKATGGMTELLPEVNEEAL